LYATAAVGIVLISLSLLYFNARRRGPALKTAWSG
jgi:hypothetical protein